MLGKGGRQIKAVGQAARAELEQMLGWRVHLFLFVKVRPKWPEDPERYSGDRGWTSPGLRRCCGPDEGVLLAVRRHGESGAMVSVFTARHGRHAGLVRGGFGRRARPVYQPGNVLAGDLAGAAQPSSSEHRAASSRCRSRRA